jgi:hypothetical protein
MSSVIKLHKKQVEDRNVCRSFCNETTAVSQLLRRLTQSLISQEEKKWPPNTFPIIKDSRLVVRRIEQMNTYIQEAMEDKAKTKNLYHITNNTVLISIAADIKKMYPSITPALIVETIDTHLLCLINSYPQDSENQKAAKNLREMMIPLIIFVLEHAFIYIQQGNLKTFFRQVVGIPTGASYSDSLPSFTVYLLECPMLKKLKAMNIDPLIYARFVDDTFIQILSEKDKAENTIESIKEALNSMDPCLTYTVESTITFLLGKKTKKKEGTATPFLDLNTIPTLYEDGKFRVEVDILPKPKATPPHTPWLSAQPLSVKLSTLQTERHRYLTRCTTELFFRKNWSCLVKDLTSVGYPTKHISHVEENLKYENRPTIMQEMDHKAKEKAEAGWQIDTPEISNTIIPLILSARPGAQAWFSSAAKSGLTFFEDFPQEAKEKLPSKIMRCLTKTISISTRIKQEIREQKGIG